MLSHRSEHETGIWILGFERPLAAEGEYLPHQFQKEGDPLARYIVYGTWCEYIAKLCVEAESPEKAKEAWDRAFANRGIHGFNVQIWDLDGAQAWLEKKIRSQEGREIWEGNGHTYYFSGYRYSDNFSDY